MILSDGSRRSTKVHTHSVALGVCLFIALLITAWFAISCGGGTSSAGPSEALASSSSALTASDVSTVVQSATQSVNAGMVVAVADRVGNILAIFRNPGAPTTSTGNFGQVVDANELAVGLARTAAFFSNNAAPLSSRTVRYLSGVHFPPGISFTANADLYGIENTNRGCSLNETVLPHARSIDGSSPGLGVITGKADVNDSDPAAVNPGGVPLFKGGLAVGGVGVVAAGTPDVSGPISEFAAFSGAAGAGFLPSQLPAPGVVVIAGIALPFVNQQTIPNGMGPGSAAGSYLIGPVDGSLPPEGYLLGPNGGTGGLSQSDVSDIISQAVATASITRAVIRLPSGSTTRMTIAVSDLDGTLLGLYRMPDGTVFSTDVAASKARNVVWFSQGGSVDLPGIPTGTAVTNRTISFGAQPFFPPGIDGSGAGPFFNVYLQDVANPCTQGSQPKSANQSGIVFFPGSVPLYKGGVLVGGLGVSGDGVDQDDFVTNGGAAGFQAAAAIRADQVVIRNVRLPYLKFPRNPTVP